MSDVEDDYVIIESPLSGKLVRDGTTIDVQIYRGEDESHWVLEVVDSDMTSFVWDGQFETDQAAMDELLRTISAEGMKAFNPAQYKKLYYRDRTLFAF